MSDNEYPFPPELELNQTLLFGLKSNNAELRLIALGKIEELGIGLFSSHTIIVEEIRRISGFDEEQKCRDIARSILAGEKAQCALQNLEEKLIEKRQEMEIDLLINFTRSNDKNVRLEAVERLVKFGEKVRIKSALVDLSEKEENSEIKSLISDFFSAAGEKREIQDTLIDKVDFFNSTVQDQKRRLSELTTEKAFFENKDFLGAILLENLTKSAVFEILTLFEKFGKKDDSRLLSNLLKHQDVSIQARAIRTCGKLDLDTVLLQLNVYLQHEDPRVKIAGLEIFLESDKEGALRFIKAMSEATQVHIRGQALSLFPRIEYAFAEPLAISMFRVETDPELKNQLGIFLAMNPSEGGVIEIFRESHGFSGKLKQELRDIWILTAETWHRTVGEIPEKLEERLGKQISLEKEFSSKTPIYNSSEKLVKKEKIDQISQIDNPKFRKILYSLRWQFAVVLLLLLPMLVFVLVQEFEGKSNSKGDFKLPDLKFIPMDKTDFKNSKITGLRSNVDSYFNQTHYKQILSVAGTEISDFSAKMETERFQFLEKLSNDANSQILTRMFALVEIDKNLNEAKQHLFAGRINDARDSFLRALENPDSSAIVRLTASRGLIETAILSGNREEFMKFLQKFYEEMDSLPGCKGMKKLDSFNDKFNLFLRTGELLKTPENQLKLIQALQKDKEVEPGKAIEFSQKILDSQKVFSEMKFESQ
ncbi:MAG: HEAT repeat domain-containing protein [Candidatus Riflebacteria bacterium]|nr:HEAT repeat domain-containing protein [Candidatus Riflebacteria bacterium]